MILVIASWGTPQVRGDEPRQSVGILSGTACQTRAPKTEVAMELDLEHGTRNAVLAVGGLLVSVLGVLFLTVALRRFRSPSAGRTPWKTLIGGGLLVTGGVLGVIWPYIEHGTSWRSPPRPPARSCRSRAGPQ